MKLKRIGLLGALYFALVGAENVQAQSIKTFDVDANGKGVAISPHMWGVFFEDINMGADGGLYAELIKNRSFEFDSPFMGWSEIKGGKGSYLVNNIGSINKVANRHFLHLKSDIPDGYGISNEGFRGMGIKKGMQYHFSIKARQTGNSTVGLRLNIVDQAGSVIGSGTVNPQGKEWRDYKVTFTANATVPKAKTNLWMTGAGEIDIDMVSLFPQDTWKERPGGLRADMVQLLADMKPGFLRFPGGCIVEGRTLDERFQWKKTIGKPEDRELIINRWNIEFKHRLTPDYFQSFGLGFFEYFQLAEDIGATALPILNCGMACQFNTGEVVPLDQLQPYIQDALDLIEFANGPVSSEWGKKRAEMGHPEPFKLKLLGVGNENWGPQYIERLKLFTTVIKAKYPEIKIVNSGGTDPSGERFDYLNTQLRAMGADIIDEHYYRPPQWFFSNAKRYDNYDRKGSKVFAGEYAAQSKEIASPINVNNWHCALSEAAFLTGIERNADVVTMASYAPLFAHADGWQWTPDMIWIDNLTAYGTPNYQVQKLYSLYKGTKTIPITMKGKQVTGQDSLYASAVIDADKKEVIIKVVNAMATSQKVLFAIKGIKSNAKGILSLLTAETLLTRNSFESPDEVVPKESQVALQGKNLDLTLKPYSFNVIRLKM